VAVVVLSFVVLHERIGIAKAAGHGLGVLAQAHLPELSLRRCRSPRWLAPSSDFVPRTLLHHHNGVFGMGLIRIRRQVDYATNSAWTALSYSAGLL
jgi:hypothetical protein